MKQETNKKLPPNVRVMIGLCASPTLMVIGFLFYNLFTAQWREIGVSTVIFSLLGFFAYFIVIAGRIPFLKNKTSTQSQL